MQQVTYEALYDPEKYMFSISEIARASRVSKETIRSWTHRSIIKIGRKDRIGRISYSAIDILVLHTMGKLTDKFHIAASAASKIAESVREAAVERAAYSDLGIGAAMGKILVIYGISQDGNADFDVVESRDIDKVISHNLFNRANVGQSSPVHESWYRVFPDFSRPIMLMSMDEIFSDVDFFINTVIKKEIEVDNA